MPRSGILLRPGYVRPDEAADLARSRGWRVAEESGSAGFVLLPEGIDAAMLEQAMHAPAEGCLEWGTAPPWPTRPDALDLIVSTRTAFGLDLGALFADEIIARGWYPAAGRERLLLALHEALSNGLLHGNLRLPSEGKLTPDDFIAQAETLSRRLADPAYGGLPVALRALSTPAGIEIAVSDHGDGFDPAGLAAQEADPSAGRGLAMMRANCDSLHFEDEGRRCVMRWTS